MFLLFFFRLVVGFRVFAALFFFFFWFRAVRLQTPNQATPSIAQLPNGFRPFCAFWAQRPAKGHHLYCPVAQWIPVFFLQLFVGLSFFLQTAKQGTPSIAQLPFTLNQPRGTIYCPVAQWIPPPFCDCFFGFGFPFMLNQPQKKVPFFPTCFGFRGLLLCSKNKKGVPFSRNGRCASEVRSHCGDDAMRDTLDNAVQGGGSRDRGRRWQSREGGSLGDLPFPFFPGIRISF